MVVSHYAAPMVVLYMAQPADWQPAPVSATLTVWPPPLTEDRIREIIREELAALETKRSEAMLSMAHGMNSLAVAVNKLRAKPSKKAKR